MTVTRLLTDTRLWHKLNFTESENILNLTHKLFLVPSRREGHRA